MVPMFKNSPVKLEDKHHSSCISRTESTLSTSTSTDSLCSTSFEYSPNCGKNTKQPLPLQNAKPNSRSQKNSKTQNNVAKISSNKIPLLLEMYREKSSQYRDEEFTQQSCSFLAKMASDDEIPNDIKGNFSLYYILVSVAKIFMLNEYELTILACALDHCKWNIDDIVCEDEEDFLREFPCSLEVEITKESRRLIIYLLVLAFNLKSNLNPKEELELIQAYIESICKNFGDLLRRSSKPSSGLKFNFSHAEINQKFKNLSKKDHKEPFMRNLKDYNMVVNSILRLTGTHTVKPKAKNPQHNNKCDGKSKASDDIYSGELNIDTDIFYSDFTNDFEAGKIPHINLDFNRQASAYNANSFINVKREADFGIMGEEKGHEEKNNNKKVKANDNMFNFLEGDHLGLTTNCGLGAFMEGAKRYESEDFLDVVNFSRATSNHIQEDINLFSKFDFSLFGK